MSAGFLIADPRPAEYVPAAQKRTVKELLTMRRVRHRNVREVEKTFNSQVPLSQTKLLPTKKQS